MSIHLPDLDDITWKDLTEEARSLIPAWAPGWTNHNASDPGITLLELFAYVAETFLYRVNRVGDPNVREFLRLINGPSSDVSGNLKEALRRTVRDIHGIHRAVTVNDFEALTLAAGDHVELPAGETVARVKCLPERNLEDESLASQSWYAPGHVTVMVISSGLFQPSIELLRRVRQALEPARLLGTRVHVVGPRFVNLGVRVTLVRKGNVLAETLRMKAVSLLEGFFDPLNGGPDKKGWPFGRNVYVSEVYQILDELSGVDYVKRTRNAVTRDEMDELIAAAGMGDRLKRNELGELEAFSLQPYELVAARIDPVHISIAPD